MARIPATSSGGWVAGVNLLVECQGTCRASMKDQLLEGAERLRAVVKLSSYAPNDPPTCPNCGGRLKLLARDTLPSDKRGPSKKKGRGRPGKRGRRGGLGGR